MSADLAIVQGVPLTRSYRFVDAAAVWPDAVGCEARAQVRERAGATDVLLDLTSFLSTPAVVAEGDGAGTDIEVVLQMTGAVNGQLVNPWQVSTAIPPGQWCHVVLVANALSAPTQAAVLARFTGGERMPATVSDVAVYDYPLTQAQAAAHYQAAGGV